MKTKILATALALIISCSVAIAQSKTLSTEKQTATPKTEMVKDSVYYTCTMHQYLKLDKPGKCPSCGMDMGKKTMKMTETKTGNKEAITSYTCSMHPEVNADIPGKCPKCGMDLIVKK